MRIAEFAIRRNSLRSGTPFTDTFAWIENVAPRSRQLIDGGEQDAPQLSGWKRPPRPFASVSLRLPNGVPPLRAEKPATKQAVAPPQFGTAPIWRPQVFLRPNTVLASCTRSQPGD